MRLLTGMLVIGLLAVWNPITPAAAQCSMLCPYGEAGEKAKTKRAHHRHHHHADAKKHKKHAPETYMKAAPY